MGLEAVPRKQSLAFLLQRLLEGRGSLMGGGSGAGRKGGQEGAAGGGVQDEVPQRAGQELSARGQLESR